MAAYLLKKQGHEVIGVTMSLWDGSIPIPDRGQGGCFGPGETHELQETEEIAKRLGIPYEVIPLAEQYKKNVLDYFRAEYKAGRTPNPCVECNRKMKFGFLIDAANELFDFDMFATGHYARISESGRLLRRALDQRPVLFSVPAFSRSAFSRHFSPWRTHQTGSEKTGVRIRL